ncbi:flagellar hook-associated protein FlgK [Roseibium aggregatum]|uniref:Flagellar hook-associated protein 1 n=1 Tax=Roseibium aggregatum TaxID=187304 RepID=A0A926P0Q8_9HYPH|nr:flagellar hook-associated protein FlgK [Roseibium aggregatum]MBD1547831.1 flagellar hook-associated protein FlgK [Roseibium aggregatum]
MGLTSALNTSLFGIDYNQTQIDVTSANIANAGTSGYSTKTVTVDVFFDGQGNVSGIQSTNVSRVIDEKVQKAYFGSLAETNYAAQIADYTDRVDQIIGTINDKSSVPSLATELSNKLSALVNDPGSFPVQQDVVSTADSFARELNSAYTQINDMRLQADQDMYSEAKSLNSTLKNIQDVDQAIADARSAGLSTADLLDQRDRFLEKLSGQLDITVTDQGGGVLLIRTGKGQQLYADKKASTVSFNRSPALEPGKSGNNITVTTPGGTTFDLIGGSNSGSVSALAELRDKVLVQAQTQLDTIAANASLAFSNVTVPSTPTTVGIENGYTLDLSALQPGNKVSLSYVDTGGNTKQVTFVGVTDPTLLPLQDTVTPRADDKVYGVDISSGVTANYITQMIADLGAYDPNLAVSNDGTGKLQILGDTATNTVVKSLTGDVTVTGSTDQGLGLSIFVDKTQGTDIFTDALEAGGQRVGFARGIAVNPDLVADSSKLVNYQTTPTPNSKNDPSRAKFLLNAFANDRRTFDPGAGIGSKTSPYVGNILQYTNQVTAFQGSQAQDAKTYNEARQTITTNFAAKYEDTYSVDINAQLAILIELQNAYAASARVMKTVNDLYDTLLQSI